MTALMDTVGGWIQEFILAIGYPGIVLVMAIENIFPPIPSELVLPFGGALSANGEMNFWGVVAAGTAGSVIGAMVLYAVGYYRSGGRGASPRGRVWQIRLHLRGRS